MLYIIGLGLNEHGVSKEGMLAIDKCKKIYLENYTVDFPYDLSELHLGKKEIVPLGRSDVESMKLIKEAKSRPIALLVYGCPLFATTHMTLIRDANEQGIRTRVLYAASIFDGLAETGLQLYKFGKITSMPAWKKSYEPTSFMNIVKENRSIKAHSLILIDIGLGFKRAIDELEKSAEKEGVELDKIVVCSNVGTEDAKIRYGTLEQLKKERFRLPICFIIPSEMHFLEEEVLREFDITII